MPLAVKPVTPGVAVAVHAKVAPETSEVSITSVAAEPEQIVCVNGELATDGIGLTVTVLFTVFEQPFASVTV